MMKKKQNLILFCYHEKWINAMQNSSSSVYISLWPISALQIRTYTADPLIITLL